MEEQQDKSLQEEKSKNSKKGKKTQTVTDEAKIREAKKKVNDLLQGTGLEEPENVFNPPQESENPEPAFGGVANDNATTWLNEQVAALLQQVEQLQVANKQLKQDNSNLFASLNGNGPVNELSGSEKTKIIELYKHFENIYMGRTSAGRWSQVNFSNPQYRNGLLDMFLLTFPFLTEYVQYQHWK